MAQATATERTAQILKAHYAQGFAPQAVDAAALAAFGAGIEEATPAQRQMVAERIYKNAAGGKGTGANLETSLAAADWILSL